MDGIRWSMNKGIKIGEFKDDFRALTGEELRDRV